MMACLGEERNTLSDRDRFTVLVVGRTNELRQDCRRKVGMTPMAQVELEDCVMAARTSSHVAGKN